MTVPGPPRSTLVRTRMGGRSDTETDTDTATDTATPPSPEHPGGAGEGPPAVPAPGASASVWVRRVGWGLLALQLAWLVGYSVVEFQRFALTLDFAAYHQAWYLIAHGDLDPYDTVLGFPFWRNNGEFLMWPLALAGVPFDHGVVLLWIQDLAVVGTEAVALAWVVDLVGRPAWARRFPPDLAVGVAVVLLVADPWVYWTAAFDFHFEPIDALLVLLAARALFARRFRWCAPAVVLALLAGDLSASLVAGLGVAALVAGRQWRRPGLVLVVVGAAWVGLLSLLGMRGGNLVGAYGHLAVSGGVVGQLGTGQVVAGIAGHPARVLHALWVRRDNIVANLAPAGLVGFLTPVGFGVPLVVLLSTNLAAGLLFSQDPFQNFAVYAFVAVGTVVALGRVAGWRRWGRAVALAVAGLLVVDTLGWAAVWLPRTPTHWLRVTPGAARVLAGVERRIPASAEVIVSQGVAGRFSGRRAVYAIFGGRGSYPVSGTTYVVVTPFQGIEAASANAQLAAIATVSAEPGSTLVAHGHGVWAFRWDPPGGTTTLTLPAQAAAVPAWSVAGAAGRAVLDGPLAGWHAAATGSRGYVADRAYWREGRGSYVASAVLSADVPVNVEVWNDTGGVLLARRSLPPTRGETVVHLAFDASRTYPATVFTGVGPFRITPVPPPPGNVFEIRVWSPGGGVVRVFTLALVPAGRAPG